MGLLEFNKLPINTLVGADWETFKAITRDREIDGNYKGKYRLTKAIWAAFIVVAHTGKALPESVGEQAA